ncbi:amidase [Rhodococcus sp. WS3]|uniref:amidase n=1 Tax=unclassified Rhodococcus (in: high G+C Gram-positive bacteria) TaxID=192944 RepID=UPI0005D3BD3B|nr:MULTISPECIES: amidase family protein [unclassified Rhodococcus (in: high G+C Gram-positive bacteria)]KJF19253.1 Glutamyl-tRNA(Gln) amidotransferase subunit A [Rhodococcus sp. AD45]ROZ42913.1 amidase [Rhodococcus sp. WS3]RZL20968.1 MAG: amidase [Rhodococcus sp. (in: high G+C Gram-positive bacteria)]
MNSEEISWAPATTLARSIAGGELSSSAVAEVMADRIESLNPTLNAYVTYDREQVLADAAELDRKQADGERVGPLHGVPFSIKMLTSMEGLPLTMGMKPFKDVVGTRDAAVVRRMRAAGGLFLGKTNTPESGYYGGTDGHLYGPAHNPWKTDCGTGGSSGGAAGAVAAGLGPLAEGGDGAGSVRIPSSICGVVGFKPSLGRIPMSVLEARHETWAFHGPITRTVGDAALMMNVVSGFDAEDPLSLPNERIDFTQELAGDIEGWRVAYSPDLGLGYVDPEVARICRDAVEAFAELGATVEEATPSWPNPEKAMWEGIWVPGFSGEYDLCDWKSMHGQVDEGFIDLMRAAEGLSVVDAGRAAVFRGHMYDTFTSFMTNYDLLVSPTLASAALPVGQFAPDWLDGESLQRRLLGWLLTYPYNMLTSPAITVPAGFTSDGRPVGLQIAGRHRADAQVLRAAATFESVRPWAHKKPELAISSS